MQAVALVVKFTSTDMRVRDPSTTRLKQILIGASVIAAAGGVLMLISLGRFLPGGLGEWFGMISGILSTPFLMEFCLAGLGLLTVLIVNHIRHQREGDEFVYLDRIEGPGSEAVPEHARWAAYRDKPLDAELPTDREQLEGAIEAEDWDTAAGILAEMPADQLASFEVLKLRIRLAKATGRDDLAAELTRKRDGIPLPHDH